MVERPIKKSERQIAPPSDVTETQAQDQPNTVENSPESVVASPEKRKVLPSIPGKERSKDRGKGSNREETAAIPPMNMALMRGPKPTKAKPPVVAPPEEVEASFEESEPELEAPQE